MTKKKSKYRVKVVIVESYPIPKRKYVIQKRSVFGWISQHDPVTDITWAYYTCEEMNANYETIRAQRNQ